MAMTTGLRWLPAVLAMVSGAAQAAPVIDGSASVLQIALSIGTLGTYDQVQATSATTLSVGVDRSDGRGGTSADVDLAEGRLGAAAARSNTSPATAFAAASAEVSYFEFASFELLWAPGSFSFEVDVDARLFAVRPDAGAASAWSIVGSGVRVYDVTGLDAPLVELDGTGRLFPALAPVACAGHVVELRTAAPIVGVGPCDGITRHLAGGADAVDVAESYAGTATVLAGHRYLIEWYLRAYGLAFDADTEVFSDALHTANFRLTALDGATLQSSTGPLMRQLGGPPGQPVPEAPTAWLAMLALFTLGSAGRGIRSGRRQRS